MISKIKLALLITAIIFFSASVQAQQTVMRKYLLKELSMIHRLGSPYSIQNISAFDNQVLCSCRAYTAFQNGYQCLGLCVGKWGTGIGLVYGEMFAENQTGLKAVSY